MKKSILITGTSKGIGKYLAENISGDFEVFGISRSYGIKNKKLYTKISTHREAHGVKYEIGLDLTDFSQFDTFCEKLEEKGIKFSSIIFNAGVGVFGDFETLASEKYKEIVKLNLLSPILTLQKLLPFLEKKGKIIFLGSISGKKFLKYGAVYQASKFGLRGFAGAIKNELGNRVHIINPKLVETDFHRESQITIDFSPEKITHLKCILETVQNILDGKEKRFEIDL